MDTIFLATVPALSCLKNGLLERMTKPISTVLTVGFGSKIPILMCLAMHESMYDNSAVKKNMKFLNLNFKIELLG